MVHISSSSLHESSLPTQQDNFVNFPLQQRQIEQDLVTTKLWNKLQALRLAIDVQSWLKGKNLNTLSQKEKSHETLLAMNFDKILTTYWPEKWLEIIQKHFIQELNLLRQAKWLPVLQANNLLATSVQNHAQFLANHSNMYDFTWRNKVKSPHIQYSETGEVLNTPKQRALDLWYTFSLIKENISTVWFVKPHDKGSIQTVLNERLWEKWHAENIFSSTQDIGVGYAHGLVVIDFAK